MTGEQLRNAITKKTKMVWFSSPCNPSGSVYSKKELHSMYMTDFIQSFIENKLKSNRKIVKKINSLEEITKILPDSEFPKRTLEFKKKINNFKKNAK